MHDHTQNLLDTCKIALNLIRDINADREDRYKLAAAVRVLAHSIELAQKNNNYEGAPLIELSLSHRSYHVLLNAGYRTIEDIENKTSYDLMKIQNMGAKSLREIEERLALFGKKLANRANKKPEEIINGNS